MIRRTRTILFISLVVLFLLVAPSIIFYSQGYRFDFETKKIVQTGAFYLKVLPKSAQIYLDSKLKKKTDFFFGTAFIENLLPKKYEIQIKKEGYHPWQKTLETKEKEVTEAKNIVLVPENPEFNILFKEVENFWFSPNERKIILKTTTSTIANNEKGWALKLFDLERKVKTHLIDKKDIYLKEVDLLNLDFSKDSKEIYLDVAMKEQEKNFVLKLDKIPAVLIEREITPAPENIITELTFDNDIFYLDNFGGLFKNEEELTEKPFPVKQETEYVLEIFPNFVFLREGQILYLFNPRSKSFEKIFEPVNSLKISPDFKKLVYFNNYEIWILFLEPEYGQPQRKPLDQLFLTRFSEKIGQVSWWTNHYLIFNTDSKIKIAEIDDRDRINIVDLAEFKNPKIFFNKNDKKLYVLSEGNLYVSENLLP